jgi:hypothetical protein
LRREGQNLQKKRHKMSGKTPIHIVSAFGSKINKFERKKLEKTKKFQKPKSCRQLP